MLTRYFKVLKGNIFIFIVVVALVVVSSLTRDGISKKTSIAAGVLLLFIGFRFIYWLIKAPVKKAKDEDT